MGGVPYYLPALCLVYFCILMIPEAFWEAINLKTINRENIPDFVLAMMKKSQFPIGIYVHWLVTPFFTLASIMIWANWARHRLLSPDEYRKYALLREDRLAKKGGWYSLILAGFICTIMPIVVAVSFTAEASNTVLRILQPFHFKLSFFFLFGLGFVLLSPAALTGIVAEIWMFLTHRR
jgi:hypothetical protein